MKYAVSPTGAPIIGNKVMTPGICGITEGSFSRGEKGRLEFSHDGTGTQVIWDDQEPAKEKDRMGELRRVFVDSDGWSWREDELRLVDDVVTQAEPLMPYAEAIKIKPGDKLRVLVGGSGEVGNEGELTFDAGEIVTVDMAEDFDGPEGWAVTVVAANGVVNVFDEADFGGWYPFQTTLPVVDGDEGADVYGHAATPEEAMRIAEPHFADGVARVEKYGPIKLQSGGELPIAFVVISKAHPSAG